ncbi:MAG: sigma-70 family RNA polymerase sigma factor [Synechococcus sp. BS307-5m-G39]|nr:sigma-70 family RNA polymerase sigma factor [Synechococcus sp. BS307-5m-G39]MBL6801161.1 sigma-70 family RNA polymerase sigma factor [Synechococcus sp. BS307-5m-G37]
MTSTPAPTPPCHRLERLQRREQHRPIPESIQKRNGLVLQHLGLAHHAANQQLPRGGGEYDDLCQEARLGLVKSLDHFDPSRGHRVSSYAIPKATGQILHYRRDRLHTLRIPWRIKDLHSRGMRLQEQRLHAGQAPFSDPDLAAALGVTPRRWQQAKSAHQDQRLVSLNAPISRGDRADATDAGERIDQLSCIGSEAQDPQQHWLHEALQALDPDHRRWLKSHWIDGVPLGKLAERERMDRRTLSKILRDTLQDLRCRAELAIKASSPEVLPQPSPAAPPRPSASH